MSQPEQSSDGGGVAAGVLQGVLNSQANRPSLEEGPKFAPADADIFDALFSKWGRDEETNMVGSFDDLLWEEGAAAVAAAAASMGWQRTATPGGTLQQLSKPFASEQPSQQQQQQQKQECDWDQASAQRQQEQHNSKPGQLIGQQLLYGTTVNGPDTTQAQPGKDGSCADAEDTAQAAGLQAAGAALSAEAAAAAAAKLPSSAEMQQSMHPGSVLPVSPSAAATDAAAAAAAAAGAQAHMNLPHALLVQLQQQQMQHQLQMQQQQQLNSLQQLVAVGSGATAGGDSCRILPQLSLQSMLHLQQQMLAEAQVAPAVKQAQQQQAQAQQQAAQQQTQAQLQAAHQQQVAALPPQLRSLLAYQQPPPAVGGSSWLPGLAGLGPLGSAARLTGLQPGAFPGSADAAALFAQTLLQQQQQQHQQQMMRPPGLSVGLPFPGAGAGPVPGFGYTNISSAQAAAAPLGLQLPPAGGLFGPAAVYAAAAAAAAVAQHAQAAGFSSGAQQIAASQPMMWQQSLQQQSQQSLQELQVAAQQQMSTATADGLVASTPAQMPGVSSDGVFRQSFAALLASSAGPAAAAAAAPAPHSAAIPQAGLMGPPAPHLQHHAATASNSHGNTAAGAGCGNAAAAMGELAQLPPELLSALGLARQTSGAAPPLPALAGLPPLSPGSWPLHLAGLLRPPPVQTTNILQLAMMMQSASQANAQQGGSGDSQQAAMVVAALQGLAANMRMFMPWTSNQAPWQPRPAAVQQQQQQQELPNGSCLASGQVMPWQLSSSFGAIGQKATLQFGSQLQTSTTDLSGQGALPGGHSYSTVVAAAAAAATAAAAAAGAPMAGLAGAASAMLGGMAGLHRLSSGERPDLALNQQQQRQKQKRKPRQFDNRVRYEGRKIRANNRVRVKGRFVKMGPNGPILPDIEHHHSDHEVSEAELSDPEAHEHHGSSGGRPNQALAGTAAAAAAAAASLAVVEFRCNSHTAAAEEPALLTADDAVVAPASPQAFSVGPDAGPEGQLQPEATAAAAGPGWPTAAGYVSDSCKDAPGGCPVCRSSSPAAADRPCLDHMLADGSNGYQQLQQQVSHLGVASWDADGAAGCGAADGALGHAGDEPCRCDDPTCLPDAHGCNEGCRAASIDMLGLAADDSCARVVGRHGNRLVQQHGNRVGAGNAGSTAAAAAAMHACTEQCAAAGCTDAADGAALGCCSRKRGAEDELLCRISTAAAHAPGGEDALASCNAAAVDASSKRQKLEEASPAAAEAAEGGMTDAAEAAAMPVPEFEMPSAIDVLEQRMSVGAAAADLAACEAAAAAAAQPVREAQPLHTCSASAAAAAAAAVSLGGDVALAAADAAACASARKRSSADGESGLADGGNKHARLAEPAVLPQLPAAAAARAAPAGAQLAAAALHVPAAVERGASGSHAIAARLVQAAIAAPGGGAAAAAAALHHWTAAQQQHDTALSPRPVQALQPQLQPQPLQQQQALWGPAMGFRTWGPGRPPGAVLAPPSLPLPLNLQLPLPLPMELLAAASLGGGVPGGAAGPHAAAALLPGFAGAGAGTAGLLPLGGAAAAAGVRHQPGGAPSPLACLPAWALMGPPNPLVAAAAAAGLPLGVPTEVRPGSCSPAPGMQLLGGSLLPVALPGACWPLAAAVGNWPVPPVRPPRQRRRRGLGIEESEQTDSCHK